MRVEIVPADAGHIIDLLDNLRDYERAICARMHGADFEQVIFDEAARSLLAYAGLLDGRCAALWGVQCWQIMSREGYVWLIGTRLVDEHPIAFLRHSVRALAELRATFSVLRTISTSDHKVARRWLEWLGFKFGEDQGGIQQGELRWQ